MSSKQPDNAVPQDTTQQKNTFTSPLIILVLLTILTQLISVAYTAEQSFSAVFLPSFVALMIVTIPLAALGLRLGLQVGLGTPLLTALISRQPGAGQRLLNDLALAMAAGLAIGAFLWLLRIATLPYLPPEIPALGHRGVVGGLLVTTSAAIGEEVWMRLGVMSILAWSLSRVFRQPELTSRLAWAAIVISALAFGLIHIPQLVAANAANTIGIVATMLGNLLVGTVCGWFFWRRSLIAAILAHFFVDLMLHVFPAMIG